MAKLIKVIAETGENIVTEVSPENHTDFKLEQLYRLLECNMIEVVNLRNGKIMIIDEEGKCVNEPVFNPHATQIARNVIGRGDFIAGHALVCKDEELQ